MAIFDNSLVVVEFREWSRDGLTADAAAARTGGSIFHARGGAGSLTGALAGIIFAVVYATAYVNLEIPPFGRCCDSWNWVYRAEDVSLDAKGEL